MSNGVLDICGEFMKPFLGFELVGTPGKWTLVCLDSNIAEIECSGPSVVCMGGHEVFACTPLLLTEVGRLAGFLSGRSDPLTWPNDLGLIIKGEL